jgi:nitrogen-specific signal transduction histidine kinase
LSDNTDEWKSWPPEGVLQAVMSELLSPLITIKGYAQLLSNESTKDFLPEYVEAILTIVDRIENMRRGTIEYLNDYYSRAR